MSERVSMNIQEIINRLNNRRHEFEDDYKHNRHFAVLWYGTEYKIVTGGEFEPLDRSAASSFFNDVKGYVGWIFEGSKKKEKEEEEKKPMVDVALFWFSYYLNREVSYYGDLYTLLYYVPSVAFTFSLRALNDIKKAAEQQNLNLRYYGELYYNRPAKTYIIAVGEKEFKFREAPPYSELVKPEEVFGWVISSENFPKDENEARNIEKAYDELVLNAVKDFGSEADEILSLIQKIRSVPEPTELDKYVREVMAKVSDAERKMVEAINNIQKESSKFMYKTPVYVVTPEHAF